MKAMMLLLIAMVAMSLNAGVLMEHSISTGQPQMPVGELNRAVLHQQVPDTLSANGYACQLDSVYPFEADIADDISPAADWQVDTIITWWSNWNGFTTWANVPNVHVLLYADNSGTPAVSPTVEIVVEAADFVATTIGTDKYNLTMDVSSYSFSITAGTWWIEVQPSTVFTVNGQTGWQCQSGIGNATPLYFRSQVLGVPNWTSAVTQWGEPLEIGIVLLGTELGVEEQIEGPAAYSVSVNDFNNAPTISLSIADRVDLNVEIFDLSGRQIDQLFNGSFQGEGSFTFDQANQGTYIYKVTANGQVTSGKLIVVE